MAKQKTFSIVLPDYFTHKGVTYSPGEVTVEDEMIHAALVKGVEKYEIAIVKKREYEERLHNLNNTKTVTLGEGTELSVDKLEGIITQEVEARTSSMSDLIKQQQDRIEELERKFEEATAPENTEDTEESGK